MANPFELRGKRVLVVGLARTGVATAQFCVARGARVTATDARTENEIGEAIRPLRAAGVNLELGGHKEQTILEHDWHHGFEWQDDDNFADRSHLEECGNSDDSRWEYRHASDFAGRADQR